jgi:hypothetical protein
MPATSHVNSHASREGTRLALLIEPGDIAIGVDAAAAIGGSRPMAMPIPQTSLSPMAAISAVMLGLLDGRPPPGR